MDNQIILQGITVDELTSIINNNVKYQLEVLKRELLKKSENDELLTREETCNLLKIDSSTLWHWTNKGKVIPYKIGNRVYYKRSEIMNSFNK